MFFIAYLGHIQVKLYSDKFLKNSEGQINNGAIAFKHFKAYSSLCMKLFFTVFKGFYCDVVGYSFKPKKYLFGLTQSNIPI